MDAADIGQASASGRYMITRADVRAKAKISDSTLTRRIRSGVFRPIDLGPHCQRFWADEVDAAIEAHRRPPPPAGPQDVEQPEQPGIASN